MANPRLNLDAFLFGGDYNPDQWLKYPDVLQEDLRLMTLSHTNAVSLGIFAWATLEPEEGKFNFDWMDERMDSLHKNGQKVILATPSGAKPNWMAYKYEEIRRVDSEGRREGQGGRHNHCMTSPVYREKVTQMNTLLAERYKDHPALLMWHISNEYGGYCYCDLCMAEFRSWLQKKYGTLDQLNESWWCNFWSHTFTDWSQVQSIDGTVNGMLVDWRRFMTEQVADFIEVECAPIRRISPDKPVTANFMTLFNDYDYWELAKRLDVISWDAYPQWHQHDDTHVAVSTAFVHDQYRAMKPDRPWLLMECTPSVTNWQAHCRPKRNDMHMLTGLQAVAHGSDAVLHFQFRKGRGSCEQHHGAFVDHTGDENNRVFREVTKLGKTLVDIKELIGVVEPASAAVVFDWPNRWAIDGAAGPRNANKDYEQTCIEWYRPLWEAGVATHIIDQTGDLSGYKLVIAPMSYMIRDGFADRVTKFVEEGGVFVTTYLSGWVDETTLAYTTGFPGPLRKLLGIWAEEMDILLDNTAQTILPDANALGLCQSYKCQHYAEIIHLEGAEAVAVYGEDYYSGQPAITVNNVGAGKAIFVASRSTGALTNDVVNNLISETGLQRAVEEIPKGVNVQKRGNALIAINLNSTLTPFDLDGNWTNLVDGAEVSNGLVMQPYGSAVLVPKR